MGSLSLLQGIFSTQESNPGLPELQADSLPSEKPGEQVSFQEISIGKEEKITKDGFSNTLYYEVGDRNRDD